MMNPRFRGLGAATQQAMPDPSSKDGRLFKAYQMAIEAEAAEAIQAADTARMAAETECSRLRTELSRVHQQMVTVQREAGDRVQEMHDKMEKEHEGACKKHEAAMQALRGELAKAQADLGAERQARATAEAKAGAADGYGKQLTELVGKLKPVQNAAPQPIIPPAAAKPVPFNIAVAGRDANGRITSLTVTPTT